MEKFGSKSEGELLAMQEEGEVLADYTLEAIQRLLDEKRSS
ncbi:MAG: hypothetical protein AAGH79_15285 [Bacteroidota bacterium]